MENWVYLHRFRQLKLKGISYLLENLIWSFHLACKFAARSIVLPMLCCYPDFVTYVEVYLSSVFIGLSRVSFLGSDHIFLCVLPGLVESGDERFSLVPI